MAFLGQEEELREFQDRFRYVYLFLFLGLGILVSRMMYLQVFQGDRNLRLSEENRIKRVKIAAPRGMIFDRNRTLIVDNRPSFDLEVTPQYLKESGQSTQVIQKLASIIDMKEAEIQAKLDKARHMQQSFLPVKIKTDISRDEVAKLETWRLDMPGVSVEMEIQRTNIYKDIASHLIGYIGAVSPSELQKLQKEGRKIEKGDFIGKVGIEKQMEETLRGVDGQDVIEVDALGRRILSRERGRVMDQGDESAAVPASPGKNLILTIDQDLQLAAARAFEQKSGGLVALDPRNGEILAMISRPGFDPTEFSRGISNTTWKRLIQDENRPLRDKTLQDYYSPGSTYKIVTAIAGLEEGLIDEHTKIGCSGSIQLGNRTVHCHKKGGHGEIDVVRALTLSCDVFFYRVVQKMKSIDDLAKWAFALGLGEKTNVELPREVRGLIPTEAWKMKTYNQPWTPGDSVAVAIGQGAVLTTAIQMANTYASIANGGTLYKPFYVKAIETVNGESLTETKPQVLKTYQLKDKTLELIRQGIWGVVNSPSGTAYARRIPGGDMAGKSGTVQVIRIAKDKIYQRCELLKYTQRHHGWFIGYAPASNPEIAVAVIAEHACSGGGGAGPVVREVIRTYLEKYRPELLGDPKLREQIKIISPIISESDEEVVDDLPENPGRELPESPEDSQSIVQPPEANTE